MSLGAPILQLSWWRGRGVFAAVTEDETIVLNESVMQGLVCGELSVLQENATELSVYFGESGSSAKVNTSLQVRGLAVGRSCFVVWSGKVLSLSLSFWCSHTHSLNTVLSGCASLSSGHEHAADRID
jgi:hypothetical protein